MITLILGGARSGKSAVAERLAAQLPGPVTYVATAAVDPADHDHQRRVEAHQARRPAAWSTVETKPSSIRASASSSEITFLTLTYSPRMRALLP